MLLLQALLALQPLLATAIPVEPLDDVLRRGGSDFLAPVPEDSLAITLFAQSAPICDRHQASYHTYTYNSSTLGGCKSPDIEIDSPYKYFEVDQLPEVFQAQDIVVKFYTDSHCQVSEESHLLKDLEVDKCEKMLKAKSLRVFKDFKGTGTTPTAAVHPDPLNEPDATGKIEASGVNRPAPVVDDTLCIA